MREISMQEVEAVAGAGDLWDDFLKFFSTDQQTPAAPAGNTIMQTVVVVGQRMSDFDKITYDLNQIRSLVPSCDVQAVVNPSIVGGKFDVTISKTGPAATIGGNYTHSSVQYTIKCPPTQPGTQPSY